MANAYICDACGKFYTDYKPPYILKSNYGFEPRYDICPDCMKKIENLFPKKEDKEKDKKRKEK